MKELEIQLALYWHGNGTTKSARDRTNDKDTEDTDRQRWSSLVDRVALRPINANMTRNGNRN